MSAVFADAGFWIALLDPRDGLHAAARKASAGRSNAQIVTSEMVLGELLDAFADRGEGLRRTAASFVRGVSCHSKVKVVPMSRALFLAALELYERRADKEWGVTDCASFCVMKKLGIVEALSHDHHFVQAGFSVLLRTP
jgi:hypothetical protein